jgi:hypothetical protein
VTAYQIMTLAIYNFSWDKTDHRHTIYCSLMTYCHLAVYSNWKLWNDLTQQIWLSTNLMLPFFVTSDINSSKLSHSHSDRSQPEMGYSKYCNSPWHHSYFNRWFGDSMKVQYNSLTMLLSRFMQEFGPISSHVYCIFAQITNNKFVVVELSIRNLNKCSI